MKRKSKIIISITGIFLVLLILSGLTYAYFLTNIQGNTNEKSVSVTTANLQLVYNDGNGTITGTNIVPGTTLGEKTFSVTNTGNVSVSYGVYIEDVINEFERTSDITLTLTCESNKANTTCDGASTIFPENNRKIVTNDISSGETQTYRLVVEYIEAGVDQSVDMGKRLSGKVQIYGSERLTLEFNIANSASGDYGIIESEPKTSYATIENGTGTYRFVGVEIGAHTLTIYDKNGNIKGHSPITIRGGNTTSVSGNEITLNNNDNTEEVVIPAIIENEIMELGEIRLYESNNPYPIGTLAQKIVHNAMFVTEEEKSLNYAEFKRAPLTVPAQNNSTANEKELSITEEEGGNSYYFRGVVQNNYLNFNNMCFRIVRIDKDGGVKLILASQDGECSNQVLTNDSGFLKNDGSVIRTNFGYRRKPLTVTSNGGSSGVFMQDYLYSTSGTKKVIDDWFNASNFNYNKLKENDWCLGNVTNAYNDQGVKYELTNDMVDVNGIQYETVQDYLFVTYTTFYYRDRVRLFGLGQNKVATLNCNEIDDVKYTSYVGLLTVDEVAFAGSSSESYYLKDNASSSNWWVSSLSYYSINYDKAFRISELGNISYYDVDGNGSVRPSIVLKPGIEIIDGNGSLEYPYEVE